jgi:hypothetical protein
MKEFSEELADDRKFEIGGQVLQWRYPHAEELAILFDEDEAILAKANGDKSEMTNKQALDVTIKRIEIFLVKDDVPKWKKIVADKENPVPLFQIRGLYRWLLEVTSGLPTLPPSTLPAGGGETEGSSPAASPSPEETPVT